MPKAQIKHKAAILKTQTIDGLCFVFSEVWALFGFWFLCFMSFLKNFSQVSSFKFQVSSFKGFTLLETIVALGVILSALVGPVSLVTSGLSDFSSAKNKVIATNLAQEGIELVRAVRETNIMCDALNGPPNWPWNVDPEKERLNPGQREFYDAEVEVAAQGIDTDTVSVTCGGLEYNGDPVSISAPRIPLSTRRKLKIDAGGFYGYSGQNTNFTRYVHITTSLDSADQNPADGIQDNEEMDIISTVTWNERGVERSLTLQERIYNWR